LDRFSDLMRPVVMKKNKYTRSIKVAFDLKQSESGPSVEGICCKLEINQLLDFHVS
jgi:hypothetical protein